MTRENDQKKLSVHIWLGNSFRLALSGRYVYRVKLEGAPETTGSASR